MTRWKPTRPYTELKILQQGFCFVCDCTPAMTRLSLCTLFISPFPYTSTVSTLIPLYSLSALFRSQPLHCLWAGLKSATRGNVCGWGCPTGLWTENEFHIFEEASRQSAPVCVAYSFLFSADERQTDCRQNKSDQIHPNGQMQII